MDREENPTQTIDPATEPFPPDPQTIDRLLGGAHHDPHSVLGAHPHPDGTVVRVTSRIGAVDVVVSAVDDVMPGVVSLPHGYGHQVAGTRMRNPGASAQSPSPVFVTVTSTKFIAGEPIKPATKRLAGLP